MNKETMEKLQNTADYIQDQIDKDEELLHGTDWLEVNGRQEAVDALTESQAALGLTLEDILSVEGGKDILKQARESALQEC